MDPSQVKMLSTLRNTTTRNSSRVLKRTLASGKEIKFGVEGRAAMLKGVDMLADAVQVCPHRVVFGVSVGTQALRRMD